MIEKPKIGQPCNGCGICCKTVICMNGAYAMHLVNNLGETIKGPCPAMVTNKDGRVACGIILNPSKYIKSSKYPEEVLRKNFSLLVGAGEGCDELGEDEGNPEEEKKLEDYITSIKSDPDFERKAKISIKVIHGIK